MGETNRRGSFYLDPLTGPHGVLLDSRSQHSSFEFSLKARTQSFKMRSIEFSMFQTNYNVLRTPHKPLVVQGTMVCDVGREAFTAWWSQGQSLYPDVEVKCPS